MADLMVIVMVMVAMVQILGITMMLLIMATHQNKEWHPSPYQPMQLLIERGRAQQTTQAAAQATGDEHPAAA